MNQRDDYDVMSVPSLITIAILLGVIAAMVFGGIS
jgi:hypothetical protein